MCIYIYIYIYIYISVLTNMTGILYFDGPPLYSKLLGKISDVSKLDPFHYQAPSKRKTHYNQNVKQHH